MVLTTSSNQRTSADCISQNRGWTIWFIPLFSLITVTLYQDLPPNNGAYLCVFNNEQWIPVALSKRKNNRALFTKLGREIVYSPMMFNEVGQAFPAAPAFLLRSDGTCINLGEDNRCVDHVSINRKYPISKKQIEYCRNLSGISFEVSNEIDFSNYEKVGIIDSINETRYFCSNLKYKGNYKYLRTTVHFYGTVVMRDNPNFLYNYSYELYLNQDFKEALAVANRCRHIMADYDLELLMGNICYSLKDYSGAELHYRQAGRMCPNRFYPLYNSSVIYWELNDNGKYIEIANEIIYKKMKIHLPEIDEIKAEVKDRLIDIKFGVH